MNLQTLEQAATHVRQGLSNGVECPCCEQLCKLYHRSLYAAPVAALCRLYRLSGGWSGVYYHMRDIGTPTSGGGDFSKLKYWDLIQPSPPAEHSDPKTKSAGYWLLTDKGVAFVEGKTKLQKSCYVYNNKVREFEGSFVSVHDALNGKFDYADVTGRLI